MEIVRLNQRFQNRNDVLRKFGFTGKVLIQALWRIPDTEKRYVWIATDGKYDGGLNSLTNEGRNFADRRDPGTPGADSYGHHEDPNVERLLFLNTQVYRQPVIKFVGVFMPDPAASVWNVSAWTRVCDECALPDGSWPGPSTSNS